MSDFLHLGNLNWSAFVALVSLCIGAATSFAAFVLRQQRQIWVDRAELNREKFEDEKSRSNTLEANLKELQIRVEKLVSGEPDHIKALIGSAVKKLSETISDLKIEMGRLRSEIKERDGRLIELSHRHDTRAQEVEALRDEIDHKNKMITLLGNQIESLIEKEHASKVLTENLDQAALAPFIVESLIEEFGKLRAFKDSEFVWTQVKKKHVAKLAASGRAEMKARAASEVRIEKQQQVPHKLSLKRTFDGPKR